MDKLRVYVAGPYSKGDVMENIRNAILAADKIHEAGHAPFIPHLTGFWHFLSHKPYEDWLAIDLVWLKQCHCLVRIPGESSGAYKEVKAAIESGLEVFYGVESFLQKNGKVNNGVQM